MTRPERLAKLEALRIKQAAQKAAKDKLKQSKVGDKATPKELAAQIELIKQALGIE